MHHPCTIVMHIVAHAGRRRHSAVLPTLEGVPEGLDFWSYKLIDAQRLDLEELVGADSPLLGLFRLEQLARVKV